MRLGQAATVGALVSLALVLPACGGGGAAVDGRVETAAMDGSPARAGTKALCRRQVRPFLASLDALREALAVGLSYDAYMRELRRVRRAYGRIRAGRLQVGCLLAVAAPAERALDRYVDAANAWGECLATAVCEVSSIERKLQRRWARASDLLGAAQAGL